MTTKRYYNSKNVFDSSDKWHGVVAEDLNETTLQGLKSGEELKQQKDFCYTVQVRIRDGWFPNAGKDIQEVKDLPFARVVKGSSGIDTPIYRKGEHVYGYWDGNTPVIEGLDIFSYAYVPGQDSWGESLIPPETMAGYSLDLNGNINYAAMMQFENIANESFYKDIKINYFLPCPDDVGDTTVATTAIKNLIKELEGFKTGVNNFGKTEILDKIDNAEKAIERASEFISGWISEKIKWLQEEIMKKINASASTTSNALPLNARFPIRDGQNILVEALYCLFNKILDNLQDFIADFLNALIDQFINVPLCIIENFLKSLLSQIVGLITSVLNAVSGVIGSVFGLITGVIDIVIDLLEIFSCEPTQPCPDVKEWNILEGGKSGSSSLDFGSILSSIESSIDQFSSIANAIYDPNTGEFLGVGIDDFSFNIEGIFTDTVSSCSGAPILCGPPTVSFFGGSGSGANGNVVVGLAGDILGVDITDSGSGYTSAPYVNISDNCGKGRGVVAYSEIEDGKVVNVVIDEPGFGYLSSSDGSLGGDGRVWATSDQTIVIRDNGKYETPYSPGDVIELNDGDKITYPDGTTTIIQTDTGTGGTGTGGTGTGTGGTGTGTGVTGTGTGVTGTGVTGTGGTGTGGTIIVTAPQINKDDIKLLRGFYPSNNIGEYPIFLTLCDVKVVNRGGNYSPNDKIIITPDNGAELSVTFNSRGMIDKVKVIKSGNGFTTRPKIYIQSETGFNAKIIPILCVNRIRDDEEALNKKVTQDQIVKVIDCVGKFS